ncbi:MAG: NfeD family protein [Actinomycetota bacterium]|nr:NfeD family protein [Actinomycetota bacterium]
MYDWLSDNAWVVWAGLGVVLAVAELVSLDLVLLMFAVGAFSAAAVSLVGVPLAAEVAVAAAVSAGMLALVRPNIVQRLHSGPELTTGHDALVGKVGVVVEPVSELDGRVRLGGEIWTARSYDPQTTIEPGARVRVFAIEGATAVVYPDD